jgi:hypothetical protein
MRDPVDRTLQQGRNDGAARSRFKEQRIYMMLYSITLRFMSVFISLTPVVGALRLCYLQSVSDFLGVEFATGCVNARCKGA